MLRAPWTIGIVVAAAAPAWAQAPSPTPETGNDPAAQPTPPDPAAKKRARKLARNARKLVREERYVEAIPGFEEAYGLWPLPLLQLELAQCHEQAGDPLAALALAEHAHSTSHDSKERSAAEAEVSRLLALVNERWGEATVTSIPEGAKVTLTALEGAGAPLGGTTPLAKWLVPGIWIIDVSAAGYAPQTARITVAVGARVEHAMRLESLEAIAKAKAEAEERERRKQEAKAAVRAAAERRRREAEEKRMAAIEAARLARMNAKQNVAWLVLGTGVVLTGGGAFFGNLTSEAIDDLEALKGGPRPRRTIDRAHAVADSRAVSANLLLTAGLGTVLGGSWLLYKSFQDPIAEPAAARPAPPRAPAPVPPPSAAEPTPAAGQRPTDGAEP